MRAHGLWLLSVLTCGGHPMAQAPVRPGIEVLLTDSVALLAGKRLALLTNQGGLDRQGRRDVDLLLAASRARPAALFAPPQLALAFSPEHGFRGGVDRPGLPDAIDSATGTPIYSLYTSPRAPNYSVLDSVDVVLIDLQDIGARYYTYPPTAVLLMRQAALRHKRVIVLDRPNPVGGALVQGNLRQMPASLDSIGSSLDILPLAMRH
ncbi:MAG TPA: exo-beta-N-acetylmuramidase NamZ domain-containing protein, partial [Gemmatimonadales bacterium]|nr:exo-beta-N-acetylmuramidase NamZ domain-containing protein [Gemmatimonadales bacterium]